MGLIAREIELLGIPTVAVVNLRPHTERIVYPRALFARHGRGTTFGPPGDRATQREMLRQAFDLLVNGQKPGEIRDYTPPSAPETAPD